MSDKKNLLVELFVEELPPKALKKLGEAFGLWAEVKEAYDIYRATGDHPRLAAMCAMYDWDL